MPAVNPEVQNFFNHVDRDGSGKINSQELQAALVNGKGQNFSDTCCNLMIAMFDVNRTGTFAGTLQITKIHKIYRHHNN